MWEDEKLITTNFKILSSVITISVFEIDRNKFKHENNMLIGFKFFCWTQTHSNKKQQLHRKRSLKSVPYRLGKILYYFITTYTTHINMQCYLYTFSVPLVWTRKVQLFLKFLKERKELSKQRYITNESNTEGESDWKNIET